MKVAAMSGSDRQHSLAERRSARRTATVVAADELVVASGPLMAGRREIVITHAGLRYRLRITGNDKLILTK